MGLGGGTFGGAGAAALSPLIDRVFPLTDDGTLGGQADHDQPTVMEILKEQMRGSEGWGVAARGALFSGLPEGMPFVPGLLAKLAEQLTGIEIIEWIEQWQADPSLATLGDIVQDTLATMFEHTVNLLSLFGDMDFLDGDFHPLENLADWITNFLPGFDASKITSGGFPMEMIEGLLDFLDDLPGGEIIETLIENLINGGQPINVLNLFGQIPRHLFGIVPASAIGADNPNPLNNGGFDGSISMIGDGVWAYDATVGRTTLGSARTTADGTAKALLSNHVDVEPGDKLSPEMWIKSLGYTGTGTPIKLTVRTYLRDETTGVDTPVGTVTIASAAGPGATWTQLSGTYTVPDNGTVNRVRLRPLVDTGASGGTIWVDDANFAKQGNGPFSGILDMFGLSNLRDLFDLDRDTIWHSIITAILNPLGVLEDTVGRGNFGDAMQSIFGTLSGGAIISNLLPDLEDVFANIPNLNVSPYGGGGLNIGETFQTMIDQLVSGLVGAVGTGASFPDMFSTGQEVSSKAHLGFLGWDILGIRINKGFARGMLPSSTAPISLEKVGSGSAPYTFNITPTTAATKYENVEESRSLGVVRFMGNYTGVPTAFGLNIYLMNLSNGSRTCVYTSGDIKADISATRTTSKHVLSSPIQQEPGEVYGYELYIVGSGAVFVACGDQSWLHDDPDVFPRRPWSVRSGGAVSVSTVQTTSNYSYSMTDVLYVEPAVSVGGVTLPHSPEVHTFDTNHGFLIPSWVNTVQGVGVGNGGGGRRGGSVPFRGEGGDPGHWNSVVWTKGVHFNAGDTITCSGIAAAAGGAGGISGSSGASVVLTVTGSLGPFTLTCTGGSGGNAVVVNSDQNGNGPGNYTPYDSYTYVGGGTVSGGAGAGTNGIAPGGGGQGGWATFNGGDGGLGRGWARMKQ